MTVIPFPRPSRCPCCAGKRAVLAIDLTRPERTTQRISCPLCATTTPTEAKP